MTWASNINNFSYRDTVVQLHTVSQPPGLRHLQREDPKAEMQTLFSLKKENQATTPNKKTQLNSHPLSNALEKQCCLRAGRSVLCSAKKKKTTVKDRSNIYSHIRSTPAGLTETACITSPISLKYFWSLESSWPLNLCLSIFHCQGRPYPGLFTRLT